MNNAEQKRFFQQCLYDALMKLMQEQKFDNISVGELCKVAGVSRMTYYRSYNNKEDILLQHLDECFAVYLADLPAQDFYSVALSFFQFWQGQERDFLIAVVRSGMSAQLMDKFYAYLDQIIPQMVPSEEVQPFVKSFLAGGLYKMLMDWMKTGAQTAPEKMAAFLATGGKALTEA